jgi:pyridoxine 5-phosphate synthase
MTQLGVNVDHVATVRNARGGTSPDPVTAALLAEMAGADGIVCHLREDRRHIRERDVRLLLETVQTSVQLEMAPADEIVRLALSWKPAEILIVPERRAEVTTERGYDCIANAARLREVTEQFIAAKIGVSVFVDADPAQVAAAREAGADTVELHTGPYAHADNVATREAELARLEAATREATAIGIRVHAGHGLDYHNVTALLARVPAERVNIGHSIVSRAIFTGFEAAVREMKRLVG